MIFLPIYALKSSEEHNGINSTKASKKEDKKCASAQSKLKKGRHFTVLPKGLGDRFGGMERWEQVDVEGVEDEVGAHLGLFSPVHNPRYECLVERVGRKIFEWCDDHKA